MEKITIEVYKDAHNTEKNTDIWSVYATTASGKLESALEMIDTAELRNLTIGELMDTMVEF